MTAKRPDTTLPDDQALDEAAGWLLRFQSGEVTEASPDYQAWLERDEAHEEAMIRARIAWGVLGDAARSPELTRARSDALSRATTAAANRWRPLGARPAAPERPRPWIAIAAAAALIAVIPGVIVGGLWMAERPTAPQQSYVAADRYETQTAETRVVTLADNTRLSLDAASAVRVRYGETERALELLSGQAHFEVASDPDRPFAVDVGSFTVTALGTAFNIERVDNETLVTLFEGALQITGAGTDHALAAGQQAVLRRSGDVEIADGANLEKAAAWRQGRVFLEGDPLEVAVARMNRYSRIRIMVLDSRLDDVQIGGVFNAGDVEAFVGALEAAFEIEAERVDDDLIVLRQRD